MKKGHFNSMKKGHFYSMKKGHFQSRKRAHLPRIQKVGGPLPPMPPPVPRPLGLPLSLTSRYFNICSSYQSFHCELQNFKQIFSLNGYPTSLIDNCIRTFLDKIFSPKPLVHSCSKKILFFCIPYTGQHGLQIPTQLHKLLSKAYPHISIRFVFRPTCRLSDFFHSRTEFLLQ